MDNCSDDATPNVLAKYAAMPNVRVVRNRKNFRLNAYKKLFAMTRGQFVIEVDDDILRFPSGFDRIFIDYFSSYPDYGYLALNVEQNEKTNGAKPSSDCYVEDERDGRIVEEGPAGGWCTAFRRIHYLMARPILSFMSFSMARPEDGVLMCIMKKLFRKRIGVIKGATCLHAVGPVYAREYGLLKREREKYEAGSLRELADQYRETDADARGNAVGANGASAR